jgi:hypothetical protein
MTSGLSAHSGACTNPSDLTAEAIKSVLSASSHTPACGIMHWHGKHVVYSPLLDTSMELTEVHTSGRELVSHILNF